VKKGRKHLQEKGVSANQETLFFILTTGRIHCKKDIRIAGAVQNWNKLLEQN
jgi:hypothetical protein